jgi:hypothetical protein
MIETLKFPSGEFTHTELAKLNGKTNQQVWTRYQAAIKDGTIVSAGTRPSAGKGKPSKLWKLNPNPTQPVPVAAVAPAPAATAPAPVTSPAPVVPTEAVVVPAAQPTPVVEAPKAPEPIVAEPVIAEPAKLPEATPAAAPIEQAPETVTVEVVRVEPAPEVKPANNDIIKDSRILAEKCPMCGNPLRAIDDATGVMVWCPQGPDVCGPNEAPFGHAKTEREAYEKLVERWTPKTHSVA